MNYQKLRKQKSACGKGDHSDLWIGLGVSALFGIATSLFFLAKRPARRFGKNIDIEIRYDTEKDADTTFLAQNLVKIIRIVLSPLHSTINREGATLIFVCGDNSWEIRVRNGSEKLRKSVRRLLESKEW